VNNTFLSGRKIILFILFLSIFSFSLVSALPNQANNIINFNYPQATSTIIANGTISNDTWFFRGLSPQQVANLFIETDNLSLHLLKDNWNLGSNWLTYSNPTLDFNSSKLTTIYYNATQSLAVAGTIDGGTLTDTNHQDGKYDGRTFNFSEVSATPGLDLRINFTGITSFNQGVMRYKTASGLAGDYPIIQMWNYDTNAWEDYPPVAQITTFATITQPVFDSSDHVSGGVAQMRIYKATKGNTGNKYYVDWIAISQGFGTPSGEEVDRYSWHRDGNINATGYNITADYLTTTVTGTFGSTYQAILGDDTGTKAGHFTDGTRTADLADGTYAINANGMSYFYVTDSNVIFNDGARAISAMGLNGLYGATISDDQGNQVDIADGTYAINAVGDSLFTGAVTTTGILNANGGSIKSSTGAISFDNENLSTTGTLGAGITTITSTTNPQLTIKYDANNYGTIGVTSQGIIQFDSVGNAGVDKIEMLDRVLISGRSGNSLWLNQAPYAGTYPLLQMGTSSSNAGFSATGTYLGVNSASTYAGDYLNFLDNGVSVFKVDYVGNLTTTGTIYNKADNSKHYFGAEDDASITYDGTNLIFNTNLTGNGIAWFSNNLSAQNLIDRSWYWDNKLGSSLSFVKDSKSISSDKDLNNFEQANYQVTDFSRPVEEEYEIEICEEDEETEKIICHNETKTRTIYPYTKTETGRLVSAVIGKHEQNIYDLLQRLETAEAKLNKDDTCLKDAKDFETYKECVNK